MADQGNKGKGEREPRRNPRKRGKTCGRPFKAPRPVSEVVSEVVQRDRSGTTETDNDKAIEPEQTIEKTRPESVMPKKCKGWVYIDETILETELQDDSSDDDIPVATILRQENLVTLTEQQIKDCQEGPQGKRAIGVTIAKMFDGVQFKGTVDSFREARQRHYYHVVYTDGDEEELTQTELRDGFLLGLSDDITSKWNLLKAVTNESRIQDKSVESEVDTSEGEGSEYDKDDFESELKNKKRQRKENKKSSTKKKQKELSAHVLPLPGEKTVASEAFGKLTSPQKKMVAERVNKTTKKVKCGHPRLSNYFQLYIFFFVFALGCA